MPGSLPTIYRLKSSIRDYSWGILNGISNLFSWPTTNGPEAELWMGAHPSSPSPLQPHEGNAQNLLELIQADSPRHLGATVAQRFESLPYLFKVLAAAEPLSLQVHPSATQAQAGFKNEEKEQVPLGATSRMYKDPRHKPELILSLTNFQALVGFLDHKELLENLRFFEVDKADSPLVEVLRAFEEAPDPSSLRRLVETIFELTSAQIHQLIERATAASQNFEREFASEGMVANSLNLPGAVQSKRMQQAKRSENVRRLAEKYPGDPGVVISLLLRLIELKPGEALFLSAGNLHAYIEGIGLEIMANSDNVLRGGLTPKYVNIPELMNSLDFSPAQNQIYDGEAEDGLRRYRPSVDEFELDLIELKEGKTWRAQGPDILLMLEGKSVLRSATANPGEFLELNRGEQVFCSAMAPYEIEGRGLLARASVGAAGHDENFQSLMRVR